MQKPGNPAENCTWRLPDWATNLPGDDDMASLTERKLDMLSGGGGFGEKKVFCICSIGCSSSPAGGEN